MKKKIKYGFGGTLSQLSPLLGLIPGVGPIASMLGGAAGTLIDGLEQNSAMDKQIANSPTAYKNSSAFGYAMGGELDALANGTYQVNGNPSVTDSVNMNYKGAPIALDDNETLDTLKNRVMSDKVINPTTGNSFAIDDAKLKRMRASAEKMKTTPAKNTVKLLGKIEDDLFKTQELLKMGQAASFNQEEDKRRGFAGGGPIEQWGDLSSLVNSFITKNPQYGGISRATAPIMRSVFNKALDATIPRTGNNNIGGLKNLGNQINLNPLDIANNDISGDLISSPVRPIASNENTSKVFSMKTSENIENTPSSFVQDRAAPGRDLSALTMGDKIGLGTAALGVLAKAPLAFRKVQKEPYHINNTAITKQRMNADPYLSQNTANYQAALSDLNNRSGIATDRLGIAQQLYAQKLKQDNQTLLSVDERNKSYQSDYENKTSNRFDRNAQSIMQTDDLNSRNEATARNRQLGFLSDLSNLGQFTGNVFNQKQQTKDTMEMMKQLYPSVYDSLIKRITSKDKKD